MWAFIQRIAAQQGVARVLEIYEAFAAVGDTPTALMQVLDPPLEDWSADFQRWYVGADDSYFWLQDDVAVLAGDVGDEMSITGRLLDFGSVGFSIEIGAGTTEPADRLKAYTSGGAELAVYKLSSGDLPQLLAHAQDSVRVDGLDNITAGSGRALILGTWPRGTPPAYDNVHDLDLAVRLDSADDLSHFDTAYITLHFHADWNDGSVDDQGLYINQTHNGTIEDHVYHETWDYDSDGDMHYCGEITIVLDPETLDILSWEADNAWTATDGSFTDMHVAGGAVPLDYQDEDDLEYRANGTATCASITTIQWSRRLTNDPTRILQGFSCTSGSYLEIELDDEVR